MDNIIKDISNLAIRAGREILKIYSQKYKVYSKSDKSLVTEADILSNKIILKGLSKYGWPILSEESDDNLTRLGKNKVWIIDPLDGTKDFLQKTGEFSIMIGLIENGKPILGAVYLPIKDKLYFAEKGEGACLKRGKNNIRRLKVSNISDFSETRLVVSRNHLYPNDVDLAKGLNIAQFKKTGSTGIKISLIAENKADLYYNLSGKLGQWDTCAPEIILDEAGGQLTDICGKNIKYNSKAVRNVKGIVASNKLLQKGVLKYTKND